MRVDQLRNNRVGRVNRWFWIAGGMILMTACTDHGPRSLSLNEGERQRITEIVLSVAEDPGESLDGAHRSLWEILRLHEAPSAPDLEELRARFIWVGEGHRLFWTDAREAVRRHAAFKSEERRNWEKRMTSDGWLSAEQGLRFDMLMKTIASEEPLTANHGVDVSLSAGMVDAVAESWEPQQFERAVLALLTPPEQ